MESRESIYSAVFDLLSGAVAFKTIGRRVKMWGDVDRERQPALFMAQAGEIAARTKGFPAKWTLQIKLYVYAYAASDTAAIGPVINPVLDALVAIVETKAAPTEADPGARRPLQPGETNTLGIPGVSHCWIEGTIETDEGALGSQGVAIIPLSILTT